MTDWSMRAMEGLKANAKIEAVAQSLSPEERETYYRYVRELRSAMSEPMDFSFEKYNELTMRREWAAKIREEFGKYHIEPHSRSEECGACGAIGGANFMDPDYTLDGPEEERS